MKQLAIKAENISKQYRLGEVGTGTLSHDLNRFWSKIRGKEDPYLRIGEANNREAKGQSDYVWSLRDINFEIEQGDAVGIIGRNGAGKSTLLKLLSKVTQPTTGSFKVNGRIASLLEVGTGFNPEMTGRENIYLNGAILGMRRHEITRKLDEIIDFSGVERYIDTPVKRYSSGMYVRLAFAVAAHLESEILIVDEVLAVGDAEFQKKCLGKMGDVSKGEGRTVLFVSHDLSAVSTITNNSILLQKGEIIGMGNTPKIINQYSSLLKNIGNYCHQNEDKITFPILKSVNIHTSEGGFLHANNKKLRFEFNIHNPINNLENLALSCQIMSNMGKPLTYSWYFDIDKGKVRKQGEYKIFLEHEQLKLYKGSYYLKVHLANSKTKTKYQEIDCCYFEIEMISQKEPEWGWQKDVCVYLENQKWIEKNE
jgi:lipopolysaccharide transport system ATP-binding protein